MIVMLWAFISFDIFFPQLKYNWTVWCIKTSTWYFISFHLDCDPIPFHHHHHSIPRRIVMIIISLARLKSWIACIWMALLMRSMRCHNAILNRGAKVSLLISWIQSSGSRRIIPSANAGAVELKSRKNPQINFISPTSNYLEIRLDLH